MLKCLKGLETILYIHIYILKGLIFCRQSYYHNSWCHVLLSKAPHLYRLLFELAGSPRLFSCIEKGGSAVGYELDGSASRRCFEVSSSRALCACTSHLSHSAMIDSGRTKLPALSKTPRCGKLCTFHLAVPKYGSTSRTCSVIRTCPSQPSQSLCQMSL